MATLEFNDKYGAEKYRTASRSLAWYILIRYVCGLDSGQASQGFGKFRSERRIRCWIRAGFHGFIRGRP